MDSDLNRLTASEAAAQIAGGKITSEALVQACLHRIIEREDAVGAWIFLDPDMALAAARARDAEASRGPLHGIPIAVKDIIDTADMPTELGSKIYAGRRPARDATCVARLRDAGALVLGKTVTTEFATFTPGKTRNPHNPAHTPGGSSSGTAAAVADFMVPAGFGTQTSGSVIRPASFCGVCGFKPSHSMVPLGGVLVLVPAFDCVGYMARSFDDLALIHGVLGGDGDPAPLADGPDGPGRPPRIGLCRSHLWDQAEPAGVAAFEEAAQQLTALGAETAEIDLPAGFAPLEEVHGVIMSVALSRSLKSEYDNHRDKISERLRTRIEQGLACPPDRFIRAVEAAARCRSEIETVFGDFDALLTPAARGEAPAGLSATGHPTFNMVWTLLQLPCATVPGLHGPSRLPVGVQLVGRRGDDRRLLSAAKWLHRRLTASEAA